MGRPMVIGLVGGIGAGKSAVARVLADLGCVVSDSDAQARAALDEPGVRDQLVTWWGKQILGADGRIERSKVAKIVFDRPRDRKRLEGVIHPRVRIARQVSLDRAEQSGAPAMVIDAPLLFEAGVDQECDVVIFVDAPLSQRLARVRESRGWDEAELTRRESAQMSLEEKKARSGYVVVNDGDLAALRDRVLEVFERIRWNFRA